LIFQLEIEFKIGLKEWQILFFVSVFRRGQQLCGWFGDVAFLSNFWLKSTYVLWAEERITDNLVSPLKTTLQTNIFSLIFRGYFFHIKLGTFRFTLFFF